MSGDVAAFHSDFVTTPVVGDPGSFNYPQDDPNVAASTKTLFNPGGAPNRDYVSHVGEVTLADADTIQAAFAVYTSTIAYPEDKPVSMA